MTEPVRHQGAPDGRAAIEGGSQPGKAGRTRQTQIKGKPRLREKKQRPAQSVRLSDHEHALIQAGADAVGMSLAGFLAHSALAAARDQSRTAVTIATERDVLTELFAMRRQLGWAGSNLNQVAKALNSGGDVPYVKEVLADVQRAANATKKAVDRVANRQVGEAA
ncbi:plasmid mobilization relaxosome protein MobC [Streptomyces sp. S3(2020)]|uniref:plasmid mobilization protein n=1 Tax=Streptomyces sp. S3(2020) TaxID=2732044 RepID=UPI0032173C55